MKKNYRTTHYDFETQATQDGDGITTRIATRFLNLFVKNGASKQFMKAFEPRKNKIITGIALLRTPLDKSIIKALDFLSRGKYKQFVRKEDTGKAEEYIFHAGLLLVFSDGESIVMEKSEIVKLQYEAQSEAERGYAYLTNPLTLTKQITLQELIETGARKYKNFWKYHVTESNCQEFARQVILTNELVTNPAELEMLAPQDARKLLDTLIVGKDHVTFFTTLAGVLHRIKEKFGRGIKKMKDIVTANNAASLALELTLEKEK